jgi:hypothetical protein
MTSTTLQPIDLAKKSLIFGLDEGVYKIYKTPAEFISVKAKTALEAIKNCGVESIYRVERDSLDKNYVLDLGKAAEMLLGQPAAATAATAPAEAAAAPAAAAEAPKA